MGQLSFLCSVLIMWKFVADSFCWSKAIPLGPSTRHGCLEHSTYFVGAWKAHAAFITTENKRPGFSRSLGSFSLSFSFSFLCFVFDKSSTGWHSRSLIVTGIQRGGIKTSLVGGTLRVGWGVRGLVGHWARDRGSGDREWECVAAATVRVYVDGPVPWVCTGRKVN